MTAARGRRIWQRLALTWALLGFLDAAYLSFEHVTASTTLACSDNGIVNCAKVTTSSYSVIFGVPVAFLGLGYFVVMAALCVPTAYRSRHPVLAPMRLVGAVTGVVVVIYLVWAELFALDAICLWCTGVHLLTFLLFVAVLFEANGAPHEVATDPAAGPSR